MANEVGHATGRAFEGQDGKLNSNGSAGTAYAASGAITDTEGTAVITKSSAAGVMTLAAPTAGADDFKVLRIMSATAQAHTVTQTTPGFNNGSTATDVATFGAAIGNNFAVIAYQGVWYLYGTPVGVTFG